VICTGGTAAAYKSAPTFLRKGGTMVAIGLPAAGTAIAGVDPLAMIFNKLTIKGSLTGNMADVDEALDFVRRGIVKPIVTVLPFSQFKQGLALLVSWHGSAAAIAELTFFARRLLPRLPVVSSSISMREE
jgi:D-arabinose 1-dehydrogenase-like Zn-dependent alcohol dehydrogenase